MATGNWQTLGVKYVKLQNKRNKITKNKTNPCCWYVYADGRGFLVFVRGVYGCDKKYNKENFDS